MTIYALDPGPERSALVEVAPDGTVRGWLKSNDEIMAEIQQHGGTSAVPAGSVLVIEQVAGYGMPVGAEVFETVFWSGRFAEAWGRYTGTSWTRLPRRAVKLALCGTARATDATIRCALLDRYGPGKAAAVGVKAKPGPLYGIKADLWQALALAVTFQDQQALEGGARP
jgi:hypothetical protein